MSFELGSNFAFHAMTEAYMREAGVQALAASLLLCYIQHWITETVKLRRLGFIFFMYK